MQLAATQILDEPRKNTIWKFQWINVFERTEKKTFSSLYWWEGQFNVTGLLRACELSVLSKSDWSFIVVAKRNTRSQCAVSQLLSSLESFKSTFATHSQHHPTVCNNNTNHCACASDLVCNCTHVSLRVCECLPETPISYVDSSVEHLFCHIDMRLSRPVGWLTAV